MHLRCILRLIYVLDVVDIEHSLPLANTAATIAQLCCDRHQGAQF